MKLQGRNLLKGTQGDDVRLLHRELIAIGLEIPEHEMGQDWFGDATRQMVFAFQRRHDLEATGIVDQETAARINQEVDSMQEFYSVKGRITQTKGYPLEGVSVRAFDRELRKESLLGETETDSDGHYSITYTSDQLVRPDKAVDMLVRVLDPEGNELTASEIHFNARHEETIDFVLPLDVYRGPSEYKRLQNTVSQLLGTTPLTNLQPDEISYLANKAGLSATRFQQFVDSKRSASEGELSAEFLYACARQGLPGTASELARQDPQGVRSAITSAVDENRIRTLTENEIDDALEALEEIAIDQYLQADDSMVAILATSPMIDTDGKKRAIVSMALKNPGAPPSTWQQWATSPFAGQTNEIRKLKEELDLSWSLGQLSQQYAPMVQALQEERGTSFSEMRDLTAWTLADWKGLTSKTGAPAEIPGDSDDEKATNYANSLYHTIEADFPTAALHARLEQLDDPAPGTDVLLEFLDQNPDFEFGTSRIDSYVKEDISDYGLDELRSWDRLAKISPVYERAGAMSALKKAGFDSAHSITRKGYSSFIESYSEVLGGRASVEEIWSKANLATNTSLNIYTNYGSQFNEINPAAIPQPNADEIKGIPNWEEIFGSHDFCECKHCNSVYGPAAYFVDLLSFLDNATGKNGRNPLDVLLSRRPDLAYIELSCENTNTLLPYVDLVLEVLEHTTKVPSFQLPDFGFLALLSGQTSNVAHAFAEAGFPLSEDWMLTEVEAEARWHVKDGIDKYEIVKEGAGAKVYVHISKQTMAEQEEIGAYPDHLNTAAYDILAQAVYPWKLPFNLWDREARLYMDHLGFKRYLWMEKIRKSHPFFRLDKRAIDVACEYLDITALELSLITGANEEPEKNRWGLEKDANITEALRFVSVFLDRADFREVTSEIKFARLQQLLETRYVNPNPDKKRIVITRQGDPCDLEQAQLKYSSSPALNTFNRIRRFLRMQRKLGWSIYDLDRAITAFGADLNDEFLVQTSHIARLQEEFKIPIAEMLTWWSLIDTGDYVLENGEQQDGKSLYRCLFLDRSVGPAVKSVFELNADKSELTRAAESVIDHAGAVSSALEIDADDLTLLLNTLSENGTKTSLRLTLENLSHLYQIVSLAKALHLSVSEFLAAKTLTGINPFDNTKTENTLRFCDTVSKVRASNFDFAELDYLLRHQYAAASDLVPATTSILQLVAQIRSGLIGIEEEVAGAPDPQGNLVREKLALLLSPADAEKVVTSLRGYSAELEALPEGIEFPLSLRHRVSYAEKQKKLHFSGILSQGEKDLLLDASTDEPYRHAVEAIFQEPRTQINQVLGDLPMILRDGLEHLLELDDLSPERVFGAILSLLGKTLGESFVKQQISTALGLDAEVIALLLQTLVTSRLNQSDKTVEDWLALSTRGLDAVYQSSDSPALPAPGELPKLKDQASRIDLTINFDWDWEQRSPPVEPGEFLFRVTWRGWIEAEQSDAYTFRVQADGAARLHVDGRCIMDTVSRGETSTDAEGEIELKAGMLYPIELEFVWFKQWEVNPGVTLSWRTPSMAEHVIPAERLVPDSVIKACKDSYALLHKLALLISRFGIQAPELHHISKYSTDFKDFDVNLFPLESPAEDTQLFRQWELLNNVFMFRDLYAGRDFQLIDVFATAQKPENDEEARQQLAKLTVWDKPELDVLAGEKGFAFSTEDFKLGRRFMQLHEAYQLSRCLGISAEQLCRWSKADFSDMDVLKEIAGELRQTIRGKYGREQWLKVARSLRDELREEQRAALVSHLVHKHGLEAADDLYAHFLVDVEMDACMLTSRIKQAIGVVQLFVQRCLMNLEPDVSLSPGEAREWKWRKNYRVWEANRKVFLYPENWVEPELRDDKSPFFQELEDELLQGEITDDTVETAYRHYLEKLDEVARLEIMGMYHQVEKEAAINVLHVFGRTRGEPHTYYYRRWINESYWTAWERVDLDIEGDHLIPVVWNRRLYLFWPIFKEKTLKFDYDDEDDDIYRESNVWLWDDSQAKYWEIRMRWSFYTNSRWVNRRTSEKCLDSLYSYDIILPGEWDEISPTAEPIRVEHPPSTKLGSFSVPKSFCYYNYLWNHFLTWDTEHLAFSASEGDYRGRSFITIRCYLAQPSSGNMCPIAEFRFFPDASEEICWELKHAAQIKPPFGTVQRSMLFQEKRERESEGTSFLTLRDKKEPILERTPENEDYRLLAMHQHFPNDANDGLCSSHLIYMDQRRTFLMIPMKVIQPRSSEMLGFFFETFYHPWLSSFIRQIGQYGVGGLLEPSADTDICILLRRGWRNGIRNDGSFCREYAPTHRVFGYPSEDLDLSQRGPYSPYNWELFFHIPLLVADRLSQNQRFEEAIKWFHYIFDPLEAPAFGLLGTYFRGTELGDEVFSRIDSTIDFEWGAESPDPRIEADQFSVRWTGKLQPPTDGEYTFTTKTDDGVRLWIDGRKLLDHWDDLSWNIPEKDWPSGSIHLQAERLYDLRMEHYEKGGQAGAKLYWQGPDMPQKVIIPQHHLLAWKPFWKLRPFSEVDAHNPISKLMRLLAHPDRDELTDDVQAAVVGLEQQIDQWQQHPFKPHLIARMRLVAYMKNVVMKYIDTLIAWGDQLFRQDSIESINEATQLYILAAEVLGQRPAILPAPERTNQTYGELKDKLDEFSNTLVRIENLVPEFSGNGSGLMTDGQEKMDLMLYFGIPHNDKLLACWDTVEDRLFKIRHCMNIEGMVRQLPLFQPPIDPGLLVRAAAAGVDIGSVLRDLNAPIPHYRFQVVLQKAIELCAEVRSMGAALLSALEKRDAEELSLLRSTQEIRMLKATRLTRKAQIDEAEETIASLNTALELTQIRHEYYKSLERISPGEKTHHNLLVASALIQLLGQELQMAGSSAHGSPNYVVGGLAGAMGGPITVTTTGGSHVGAALQAFGQMLGMEASWMNTMATLSSIMAGYARRWDEWKLQESLAKKESEQIEKQIAAAEIRLAIAERELENHDLRIENAKAVDDFMRDKFTNQQLYNWMVSQISGMYFQSYQMAYDLAKQAERAFQHELTLSDASFIEFGYWNSLKKGLLSGEALHLDLRRMEMAYHDHNKREYELTKHISLRQLNPLALLSLKAIGSCEVSLPEWLFDLDTPGHYMRRIKSVSLSIPAVIGPYNSVNCTLSLLRSELRRSPLLRDGVYERDPENEDNRFVDYYGTIQSVVTSNAQNDSGLFETNLRDERFLPFEGHGVVSTWKLELPKELRQFDYNTISDVILHVRYTARQGGEPLRNEATDHLLGLIETANTSGLVQLFSLRHDFPTEWHRFLHDGPPHEQSFEIHAENFPYVSQGKTIQFKKLTLFIQPKANQSADVDLTIELTGNGSTLTFEAGKYEKLENVLHQTQKFSGQLNSDELHTTWILKAINGESQDPDRLENIALLCYYTIN